MPEATKRFTGRVALVSASTAGIGLGIARRLGEEGAKVVICSRKENKVREVLGDLQASGIECTGCAANVSSLDDIKRVVELAAATYGRIDLLVSNAGVNPSAGLIVDTPDWAIDKMLSVNIKSAVQLVREAHPHMAKGGSILLVSSYTAFSTESPIAIYGVTKTALVALCKGLASELGPEGIRVNCLAPGVVPTKFAASLVEHPDMEAMQIARTALGRLGTPQDMAAAAAFLLSEEASYVTGETLVVAGGMHSRL